MKAYFGSLIDKSVSTQNLKLADKLQNELKKNFKKSIMNKKEHNTFLFLGLEKNLEKPFEPASLEKIENKLETLLQDYYNKNKTKLKKLLKDKQELKETSQIVKEFLKEIDQKLPKTFELSLKKLLSDLPHQYFEIQEKSMAMIWELKETNQIRIFLSGCKKRYSFSDSQRPPRPCHPWCNWASHTPYSLRIPQALSNTSPLAVSTPPTAQRELPSNID